MTITEWKKIARLLKIVYAELEQQAIKEGISLLSPEYTELVDKARLAVLEKAGFTLEEYREVKEQVTGIDKAGTLAVMQDTQKKLKEIDEKHIPTNEEIKELAHEVAKEYIVPPQITNEIVKEYTIEKPVEIIKTIIQKEEYNDIEIKKDLARALQQLDEIKIPEPVSIPELRKELQNDFRVFFEHNINTLDMPNFRKLAMGLQAQIDALGTGGGTWGSITGTLSNQTDLQTSLDTKANISGSLTQFVGNGNWKVFYSNGSGDITELTVGAAGTFLQGNGVTSAPTWGTPAGSGDVTKVGTPVNNQVGVWTGDGTLEGDAALTYDSTTDTLTSVTFAGNLTGNVTGNADSATTLTGLTSSVAELNFVDGVTSAIQTQLNTKAPSTAPTFATSITGSYLTASEILITDGSKNIVSAAVATYPSLAELIHLKGVTSAIQTQLNAKEVTLTFGDGLTRTANDVDLDTTLTGLVSVTSTDFVGNLTGNVTGNVSGTAATVTGAAQTAITSLGTLTTLTVDNILINGNDISSIAGTDLTITPLAGQQIVLDGTIVIDAGVVTGATSITSTAFVGALTGNADTATNIAVGGITGLGANVATFLATPSSANLASAVTGETGSGALVFGTSPDFTTGATIGSVAIPTISSTNTFTNKTVIATTNVVEEITTTASDATPDPTGGSLRNFFTVTAQAAAAAFSAPSGSPVNGNYLTIRILDNGTARALSFDSIYRFSTDVPAPTTTTVSKTMYLGFRYNSAASKWDCLAICNGF